MANLEDLRPVAKGKVMGLLAAAGHDVTPWATTSKNPKRAASNPKFCYEWSFLQTGRPAVFNIWYDQLKESSGTITLRDNLRAQMIKYKDQPKRTHWRTRAKRFDDALQKVWAGSLPVRIIINEGSRRRVDDLNAKPSVVERRRLDDAPWGLTQYDLASGAFELTRGLIMAPPFDHIEHEAKAYEDVPTKQVTGESFVRDPAVRRAAYARAQGRCEYCGDMGFLTSSGAPFLETHHIVYLSAEGPDHLDNVAALCANHHREAHYGAGAEEIRETLMLLRASDRGPND